MQWRSRPECSAARGTCVRQIAAKRIASVGICHELRFARKISALGPSSHFWVCWFVSWNAAHCQTSTWMLRNSISKTRSAARLGRRSVWGQFCRVGANLPNFSLRSNPRLSADVVVTGWENTYVLFQIFLCFRFFFRILRLRILLLPLFLAKVLPKRLLEGILTC